MIFHPAETHAELLIGCFLAVSTVKWLPMEVQHTQSLAEGLRTKGKHGGCGSGWNMGDGDSKGKS